MKKLVLAACIALSLPIYASSDEEVEQLVQELRSLSVCFKEGGQCLRRKGIKVRELGKKWQTEAREELQASIQQYNDELLQEFDSRAQLSEEDMLKSKQKMEELKRKGVYDQHVFSKDAKQMDYANQKVQLWNKFVAKWRKLSEVIKGAQSDYDFSNSEASEVLKCGADMMNDGMEMYFRGCDFEREADIFDEYGFEITEEQFNKMCEERRAKARGQQ